LTNHGEIIKKKNISLDSPEEVLNMNKYTRNSKMKKLLIASTALVATAGMAAADITMSGYAEIGMRDAGGVVGMEMHSDMDIGFKLSGASDNGLTFGASIDLDEVSGGIASTGGPHAVHVSGAFGTLTMGDTDGALDKANAEVAALTTIADDHSTHAGYNGGAGLDSGDILRYDTTAAGFGISASIGQSDVAVANDVMGYGITTTLGTVAVSAAYQADNVQDITAVSAKTTVGGLTITANYSEATMAATAEVPAVTAVDFALNTTTGVISGKVASDKVAAINNSYEHSAIGLAYTVSGVNLHANYGSFDFDDGTQADGYGLAANYGLGGGATVMVGYGSGNARSATADVSTFSVGLGLSF
jgi:outer membrane protein OmpU